MVKLRLIIRSWLNLGGKWNASRKCWVFPLYRKDALLTYFHLQETDLKHQVSQVSQKHEEPIQLIITKSGNGLWVCGSTQPHQAFLKSIGGKWNSSRKCWVFSLKAVEILLSYFNQTRQNLLQQPKEK